MKRIAPTLALLFLLCSANGQDKESGPSEWNPNFYETDNTTNLNADRKVKIHLLYSHYIPFSYNYWGVMGLKLAVLDTWGGYLSSALSTKTGFEQFYLTGGPVVNINPFTIIYFGGGIVGVGGGWGAPGYGIYGIEAGTIFKIKFLSLEAGLGSSIISGNEIEVADLLFAKLGIGVNF